MGRVTEKLDTVEVDTDDVLEAVRSVCSVDCYDSPVCQARQGILRATLDEIFPEKGFSYYI